MNALELALGVGEALDVHPDADVVLRLRDVAVDVLDVQLLGRLVAQHQPLVQRPRHVVDALLVAVHALGDRMADLLDQPLHVELLERAADNDVREQRRRREREHDAGGDLRERAVCLVSATSECGTDRSWAVSVARSREHALGRVGVAGQGWLAGDDEEDDSARSEHADELQRIDAIGRAVRAATSAQTCI